MVFCADAMDTLAELTRSSCTCTLLDAFRMLTLTFSGTPARKSVGDKITYELQDKTVIFVKSSFVTEIENEIFYYVFHVLRIVDSPLLYCIHTRYTAL